MKSEIETRPRVLIVDDSAVTRALLRSIVQSRGLEAEECEDGEQCLVACERDIPTIVLLDYLMPGLDGIQVCYQLRRHHTATELPIIMVTSLEESDHVQKVMNAGANDYVHKPVDRRILLARLDQLIKAHALHRQLEAEHDALERALRLQEAIGETLPEGIVLHGSDGSILCHNGQLLRLSSSIEASSMEQLFSLLFGGALADELRAMYISCHDNHEMLEQDFSIPSGDFRHVVVHTKNVSDDEKLRLWVFRDETKLRELEQKVQQRVKLDAVGLFAAGIAHNFNNLLGGMLGAAELLERIAKDNERAQRCVAVIRKGVDSGMRLTRKMGAILRRGDASKGGSSLRADLGNVIRGIIAAYEMTVADRILFRVELPEPWPEVAIGDVNLLEIVGNIVSNAVDAIAEKGEVRITAKMVAAGTQVELLVADTGCGMSEETMKRLFEPFYSTKKIDSASGVSVDGRGLGLWNTYNLLSVYGGEISIQSALGQGTTVRILIPVGAVAASSQQA